MNVISGLMKYDYLKNHKYKPRKPWWTEGLDKRKRTAIYQKIQGNPLLMGNEFTKLNLDTKDLQKHTMLEEISFDLARYLETGEIVLSPVYLVAYFDPTMNSTKIFTFHE